MLHVMTQLGWWVCCGGVALGEASCCRWIGVTEGGHMGKESGPSDSGRWEVEV